MKKYIISFCFLFTLFLSFFIGPVLSHADDLIPADIINYVKTHPNATPAEIQNFVDTNNPAVAAKFSNTNDLIKAIDAGGTTYAFGGSAISQYLKNILNRPNLGVGFMILVFALSIFLGALHALTPGHGKTMVAAYLVGSKGRVSDAVILGIIVTLTHTSSVILLGLVALFASQYILPQTLFPYFSLISGLMIFAIGGWVLIKRIMNPGAEPGHSHGPGGHTHGHGHSHNHGHTHSHADHVHSHESDEHLSADSDPKEVKAAYQALEKQEHTHSHDTDMGPIKRWLNGEKTGVSFWSLLSLGISGGIIPCADALVVLLIAVTLNRIVFGLFIVVAFSIGLAGVLIAIGIMMVIAKPYLERFTGGKGYVAKYLPIASSLVIVILGAFFTLKALGAIGLISFHTGFTI